MVEFAFTRVRSWWVENECVGLLHQYETVAVFRTAAPNGGQERWLVRLDGGDGARPDEAKTKLRQAIASLDRHFEGIDHRLVMDGGVQLIIPPDKAPIKE